MIVFLWFSFRVNENRDNHYNWSEFLIFDDMHAFCVIYQKRVDVWEFHQVQQTQIRVQRRKSYSFYRVCYSLLQFHLYLYSFSTFILRKLSDLFSLLFHNNGFRKVTREKFLCNWFCRFFCSSFSLILLRYFSVTCCWLIFERFVCIDFCLYSKMCILSFRLHILHITRRGFLFSRLNFSTTVIPKACVCSFPHSLAACFFLSFSDGTSDDPHSERELNRKLNINICIHLHTLDFSRKRVLLHEYIQFIFVLCIPQAEAENVNEIVKMELDSKTNDTTDNSIKNIKKHFFLLWMIQMNRKWKEWARKRQTHTGGNMDNFFSKRSEQLKKPFLVV